jgi:hypothetical protein
MGASGQVLNWIRHGVRDKFEHDVRPRPFNHGISITLHPAKLEFLATELPRFEACGAWERSHNPRYISRMLLVPKPDTNQWRLIIELRELNRYCSEFNMTCETLKHLRHLSRPGDYFDSSPSRLLSVYLTDGYCTLGIREEDHDYFTVNYRGTMWRLAYLPMGWSWSAYYFCKLTHVFINYLRRPPPPPQRLPQGRDAIPNTSYATPVGAASAYCPICSCSSPTPTTPRYSFANASIPCSNV